jgi:hypothetical protein
VPQTNNYHWRGQPYENRDHPTCELCGRELHVP